VASMLIIAACASPALSFDGESKATAACVVALVIEFSVLLWQDRQERRHRSLVGQGLLVLVAVTGLGATGLALFAGLHATQELPCSGAPLPLDLATVNHHHPADTPRGLKPHGCSSEPAERMTASIPAASRLQAVPPPTGRCMQGWVAWGAPNDPSS
jgi:hypothetical protein